MVAQAAQCRIGTSGFQYDHWKRIVFPQELPRKRWFEHYAAYFDTLEVNNTFYRVPERHTFQAWHDQTPPGFDYALKFSRFATHNKKLLTPKQTIGYFLQRAEPLLPRVSAILVQLPPRWRANAQRLDEFLAHAPRNCAWAVEMRDKSWLSDEIYNILRRHNAALCIHDMIPGHPAILTANWTYLRFHGFGAKYGGNYDDATLRRSAARIRRWVQSGIDVLAYFNNDQHGHAVRNAMRLKELLHLPDPSDRHRRTATAHRT